MVYISLRVLTSKQRQGAVVNSPMGLVHIKYGDQCFSTLEERQSLLRHKKNNCYLCVLFTRQRILELCCSDLK